MIIDCFRRPDEGCYFVYTLDQCCPTEQICEPFDDVATCEFNGEIYKEGEYFNFQGNCLDCICQKNFTGELVEPFCKRKKCNIEVTEDPISDKSAPVYYNDEIRCCPTQFIIPSYATNLITIPSGNTSQEKCEFGNNNFYNLGDILFVKYINPKNYMSIEQSAICSCTLPPLLTCTIV
ncbi:PREDICTED: uncharacterized protein LOC108559473 [Nicrophorus vespilloides]|uniref:Uncharacterized protein LOC108559473 n=1 Tax=Nicrophorus vespilloides TaxID=110193 RepID=A0ABM1MCG7_NICVS|nr:PREDICTED: uncharacterized protein LOC108559473 [Nicrophorus vespilloides]